MADLAEMSIMTTPPLLPPRPLEYFQQAPPPHPPPVPPVPPDLRAQESRYSTPSPYEYAEPLAAPRPTRLDPNMARTLDTPGFVSPQPPMPPQPPPQPMQHRTTWSPWAFPVNDSFTFSTPQYPPQQPPPAPVSAPSQPPSAPVSLTAPLPSLINLKGAHQAVQNPQHDPALRIAWCRDVFFLVDRARQNPSPGTDPPPGPVIISDPALMDLANAAVRLVLDLADNSSSPLPQHAAEAVYWRAMFTASGAYPDLITHNLRVAFRDFEVAARAGYAAAWFRLGRDYENFKDTQRARECFERGAKHGVESCTYRMGMAHLLGQLGLQPQPLTAIPWLHRAACIATVHVPQPAYVFSLLLLGEFPQASLPPNIIASIIPTGSSHLLEARKHLERAAYLHFAPAQYKLGHAYEYAQPPFPFDPLLSVQYYSLASQQGEVEADMALSKWFLCGSEDADPTTGFEKDETLAFTFAEKAAKKRLPSAEFALGYYYEVGVGTNKDIAKAISWYKQAKDHGNTDAEDRLTALSQPSPKALSRQEHDDITDTRLVRTRTQAKQRSNAVPNNYPPMIQIQNQNNNLAPGPIPIRDAKTVVNVIRQQSMSHHQRPDRWSQPPQQSRPQQSRPVSRPVSTASGRPAYALTDSPMTTPPLPGPGGPVSDGRIQRPGRQPSEIIAPRPQKTGPTTFAEMGIQGAQAKDEQCIIM